MSAAPGPRFGGNARVLGAIVMLVAACAPSPATPVESPKPEVSAAPTTPATSEATAAPAAQAPSAPAAVAVAPVAVPPEAPAAPVAAPKAAAPKNEPAPAVQIRAPTVPEPALRASTASCKKDADCSAVADTCEGCACLALAAGASPPKCAGNAVSCFVAPCHNRHAACRAGSCALMGGGGPANPNEM